MENEQPNGSDCSTDVHRDDAGEGAIVPVTPVEERCIEMVAINVSDLNVVKKKIAECGESPHSAQRALGDGMKVVLIGLGLWEEE